MIPKEVIEEWSNKVPYIQSRINKIKKRIRKYEKQLRHFEMRLRVVKENKKVELGVNNKI